MDFFEKAVREVLSGDGCKFIKRGLGDYDVWESVQTGKYFAVAHIIKSRRHANTVLRIAGIAKEL